MYESHKVFLPSPSCGPTFLRSVQYAIITQSLSGFSTDGGIVCSLKASFFMLMSLPKLPPVPVTRR